MKIKELLSTIMLLSAVSLCTVSCTHKKAVDSSQLEGEYTVELSSLMPDGAMGGYIDSIYSMITVSFGDKTLKVDATEYLISAINMSSQEGDVVIEFPVVCDYIIKNDTLLSIKSQGEPDTAYEDFAIIESIDDTYNSLRITVLSPEGSAGDNSPLSYTLRRVGE